MDKNVNSKIEIDKIDIVFTWVDYKNKEWIKKKNQDAIKCNNIVKHNTNNRYNSNLNEIKYAIRSIEKINIGIFILLQIQVNYLVF